MADESKPTLAETINSAIAEVTPAATTENTNGDSTTTDEATVDTSADGMAATDDGDAGGSVDTVATEGSDVAGDTQSDVDGDEDGAEDEVDENDPEAVKAAEAAGRTRDPKTGKFTKTEKKVETAEEKAAAVKIAADAAKKKSVKEPDAINDPIPKDIKKQTAERIQTLIKTAKESEVKVETVTGERNLLLDRIIASTASPEQYQQTLDIVRQMNSNDPVEQKKALDAIQATAAELANRLGVVLPGVDVLAKHTDLIEKVQAGQISRKDAEELAAARNARTFDTQARTAQANATRDQQAHVAAVATAKADLTALGETLSASDPNYTRKTALLVGPLKETFADLHPSKWAAAFKRAYNALPAGAGAPQQKPKTVVPTNQPLRARQATGGKAPEAKSMLDAVNGALANMG